MPLKLSRVTHWLTIERLRTTVLIGGGILVGAIAIFLGLGQWKLRRLVKDLPKRLGVDIQQQGDEVYYSQSLKGKTIFKLHASKEMQMSNGKVLLHNVRIDLYGADGQRTDTISGSEFEYDRPAGIVQAAGAVEITLVRPDVKPAIGQSAAGAASQDSQNPAKSPSKPSKGSSPAREIHVKTSGLTYNQKTGLAATNNHVDFALEQGNGSSTGATYTSSSGQLILDRDVDLHIDREGDQVTVRASHADFERNQELCQMTQAHAQYSGGTVQTANALIHFRTDGSVTELDGSGGVDLQTTTGGHMTAPRGTVNFDEQNRPQHGLLEGGAMMELTQPDRHIVGSAPTARLLFGGAGQLKQAHLEQGVAFDSQQQVVSAAGERSDVHRTWKSQVADISFVPAMVKPGRKKGGEGFGPPSDRIAGRSSSQVSSSQRSSSQVEPKTIHGTGGVVVTSDTTASAGHDIASLAADSVQAELAPGGSLSNLSGTGHAHFDQKTPEGTHQSSSSDQLDVRFLPNQAGLQPVHGAPKPQPGNADGAVNTSQIASIVQIGNVVFVQNPPPPRASQVPGQATVQTPTQSATKTGTPSEKAGPPGRSSAQSPVKSTVQTPIRATAARADYDGPSQLLHLTGSPRVRDGELDMTANQIDFARASGDAFAHGNVKASWSGSSNSASPGHPSDGHSLPGSGLLSGGNSEAASGGAASGANGPIHAIAAEAELHQANQEVTFRSTSQSMGTGASNSAAVSSEMPRLWQGGNSISAPIIVLNRLKQTLIAEASGSSNPVRTVLVSNGGTSSFRGDSVKPSNSAKSDSHKPKQTGPSIIRLRSGDLHYSEGERLATLHAGPLASVTAETSGAGGVATVNSQQTEIKLLPAGIHPTPKIETKPALGSGATSDGAGAKSAATGSPVSAKPASHSGSSSSNPNSSNSSSTNSSIDQLTAAGHVTVDWPDRKGTGEKLVYLSDEGTFTLTGTSTIPPRITDQVQGTVTGSALIYHTRDDSVTVEGDGAKTRTDTQSPKHTSKTEKQSPR